MVAERRIPFRREPASEASSDARKRRRLPPGLVALGLQAVLVMGILLTSGSEPVHQIDEVGPPDGERVGMAAGPLVIVNSTGHATDANPGDGVCTTGGTNSAGAPACTLRAAIVEANASAAVDTIHFAMPATEAGHSAGVWTIAPTTTYAAISTAMTIDATTQPGYATTPVVVIDATDGGGRNFTISGPEVTIRGLALTRAGNEGLYVTGAR